MQYLTYSDYQNIGGTLDEAAFNKYATRANGVIDYATRNRIAFMQTIPDEAKALCRDLTELYADNAAAGNVKSRSQSAGSVSESETYDTMDASALQEEADRLCCDYLLAVKDDNGVPLLYRGIAP